MASVFLERSIPELLNDIQDRSVSVRDLIDTVARVIELREPTTHAWVCYDLNALRAEAERADARFEAKRILRGLEGIPFGVKDIFNTRAFPTQMGSPVWKDFTPGNNARVVDSLMFAGALVVGKTVTAEFAVHALNETLNPHDASRTPGTSSSGSAAAVATGMVPFALGSQTAGSIVRPASFCGVWGMKPSFGMIPRTAVLKTTDSLDTIGFLAAHGNSLRTILDHLRVKGPNYPFVYRNVDARGPYPKPIGRPWRVGFVKTHIWDGAKNYARDAVVDLARRIARDRDFVVEEVAWPRELEHTHEVHTTLYSKSLAYYFQREANMSTHISSIMREMIAEGESISGEDFRKSLETQSAMCAQLHDLLSPYDIVLSLGTSSSAPLRGVEELPDPSLIWTLGHVPSVAVPTSRCPEGLPFGVQFVSSRWNDYLLLQAVEALIEHGILPSGCQPEHPQALASHACLTPPVR